MILGMFGAWGLSVSLGWDPLVTMIPLAVVMYGLGVLVYRLLMQKVQCGEVFTQIFVMTSGGPGTATESLTLQAFINWRAIELGSSAAIAYMLLFAVTFFGMIFVNLIRHQAVEKF